MGYIGNYSREAFTKLTLATKKLDAILEDEKLKAKGKGWATMQEVAPKWHKKISDYFTKHKGTEAATALLDSQRCIMGESWKGDRGWGKNKEGEPCTECKYLGTEALKLFSDFGNMSKTVNLTDSEGWNSYQARFEYHWNKDHVQ